MTLRILIGAATLALIAILTTKPDHKAQVRRDRAELRRMRGR